MSIYLVNQGKTYQYERSGSYIWSPKLNKAGNRNKGYDLMMKVRKGDYILHNSGGRLSAISIVQEDCKSGIQPRELKTGQSDYAWDDNGWVVSTKYYDFDVPIFTSNLTEWAIKNYADNSAFQINGKLRLQYLCNLTDEHAKYLLQMVLKHQKDTDVIRVLKEALSELSISFELGEKTVEKKYSSDRKRTIHSNLSLLASTDEELAEQMSLADLKQIAAKRSHHNPEPKEVTIKQYSHDPYISELAKRLAKGKCDLCKQPAPFKDSKGNPYLEIHSVVWLSQGGSSSIDNTVALCPNCHKKMHIVADPCDVMWLKIVAKNNAQ